MQCSAVLKQSFYLFIEYIRHRFGIKPVALPALNVVVPNAVDLLVSTLYPRWLIVSETKSQLNVFIYEFTVEEKDNKI